MTSLDQGLSSPAPGGGKMRDPGNEVAAGRSKGIKWPKNHAKFH